MSSDSLHIQHILECIEKIETYIVDGKESFMSDERTQDAVLRNLHTLAESSSRISKSVQEQFPDIPWREMYAFRNVVVHDYLGLDLNQIWQIVANDIPPLRVQILTVQKNVN